VEVRQITTAAVVNGTVYAPGESISNGAVVMQGSQITAVGPGGSLDVPAALLGTKTGRLAPGFDADIALLDSGLCPAKTIVGGEVLFSAE